MLRNRSTRRSVNQWLCCFDWNDFYPKSNLLWGPSIKLSSHDWYASKLVRHGTYRVSPLTRSVRGAAYQNVTLLKDRLLSYQDELKTSCITLPYLHFRFNSPTSYMSFHHYTMHFALAWTHLLLSFGIVGNIIQQSLKCGQFFNSLISMTYQYSNLNYENPTSKVITNVIGEIFNQLYKYVPVSLLIFDGRKWWYL